jgi:hypothetical protein
MEVREVREVRQGDLRTLALPVRSPKVDRPRTVRSVS